MNDLLHWFYNIKCVCAILLLKSVVATLVQDAAARRRCNRWYSRGVPALYPNDENRFWLEDFQTKRLILCTSSIIHFCCKTNDEQKLCNKMSFTAI